jgi:hypothetical protein
LVSANSRHSLSAKHDIE